MRTKRTGDRNSVNSGGLKIAKSPGKTKPWLISDPNSNPQGHQKKKKDC